MATYPPLLDPPWLKKTRPCPFYSSGSCFFASRCKFIHPIAVSLPSPIVATSFENPNGFSTHEVHGTTPRRTLATSTLVKNHRLDQRSIDAVESNRSASEDNDDDTLSSYYTCLDPPISETRPLSSESVQDNFQVDTSALSEASCEPSPTIISRHNLGPRQGRVSFLASLSEKLEKRYALVTGSESQLTQVTNNIPKISSLDSDNSNDSTMLVEATDQSSQYSNSLLTLEAITVSNDFGLVLLGSEDNSNDSDDAYDLTSLLEDDTFIRQPAMAPPEQVGGSEDHPTSGHTHNISDVSTVKGLQSLAGSPQCLSSFNGSFDNPFRVNASLGSPTLQNDQDDQTIHPQGSGIFATDNEISWDPTAESTKFLVAAPLCPPQLQPHVGGLASRTEAVTHDSGPLARPDAPRKGLRRLSLLTLPSEGIAPRPLSFQVDHIIPGGGPSSVLSKPISLIRSSIDGHFQTEHVASPSSIHRAVSLLSPSSSQGSYSPLQTEGTQRVVMGENESTSSDSGVYTPFDLSSVVLKPRVRASPRGVETQTDDPNVFYWTPAPSFAPTLSISRAGSIDVKSEHSPVLDLVTRRDPCRRSPSHPPIPSPTSSIQSTRSSASLSSALLESRLFFAIARDSPEEVARLLEEGDVKVTDECGPQSALVFAAHNDKLKNKGEIVATLLAHGADPSELDPPRSRAPTEEIEIPPREQELDPYVQYLANRAQIQQQRPQPLDMLHDSQYAPLSRMTYGLVGQDLVLDEFYRSIAMHRLAHPDVPLVFILCGPSGHGKTLFARKMGDNLRCPSRTFNATMLRGSHHVWELPSVDSGQSEQLSLMEYLEQHEGQRCIVVLDEIEKAEKIHCLWPLLVPWELGCVTTPERRALDAKEVIWIATSNIAQELMIKSNTEYDALKAEVRGRVSEHLGASLISRVTAVLPFTEFGTAELHALAYNCLLPHLSRLGRMNDSRDKVEALVAEVVQSYRPEEGVRSLQRASASIVLSNLY